MAKTRTQLREEVIKNLGDRDDLDASEGLTKINNQLDFAQLYIARKHNFQEMNVLDTDSVTITGTPATDKFYSSLPAKLRSIYGLTWQETATDVPYNLVQMLPRQWDQLIGEPEARVGADRPYWYIQWGGGSRIQLEYYPIPTVNYTLTRRYSVWPTDFASDSTESEYENKDDILIAIATHHMFQSLGAPERAAKWFTMMMDLLNDAIMEDKKKPDRAAIPRGVRAETTPMTDYWRDPFVREDP